MLKHNQKLALNSFNDFKTISNRFTVNNTNSNFNITNLSNQTLMQKYADNIKNMIQRIDSIQQKFLSILNQVFIIENDNSTFFDLTQDSSTNHSVRISHLLTEDKLQKL